jgi:hypothetical protein
MYPTVKRAKTSPTTATTQVYTHKLPKSPCADTARLPSMRRVWMPSHPDCLSGQSGVGRSNPIDLRGLIT